MDISPAPQQKIIRAPSQHSLLPQGSTSISAIKAIRPSAAVIQPVAASAYEASFFSALTSNQPRVRSASSLSISHTAGDADSPEATRPKQASLRSKTDSARRRLFGDEVNPNLDRRGSAGASPIGRSIAAAAPSKRERSKSEAVLQLKPPPRKVGERPALKAATASAGQLDFSFVMPTKRAAKGSASYVLIFRP